MSLPELKSVSFKDPKWEPLKEPHRPVEVSDDGSEVVIWTKPGTDWWRIPERNSTDGVVFGYRAPLERGEKRKLAGSVELDVDYKVQYDQAQLLVQIGPTTWFKTGLEYDGQLGAGVVVTTPWSDWSVEPAEKTRPKTYSFLLEGLKLKIFFDGVMRREVNVFGDGTETEALVGVMAASPKGGDAKTTFRNFKLSA